MEFSKIKTLRMMLDQEQLNLQTLISTNASRQEILRAEATIKQLQEQLKQVCGEVIVLRFVICFYFIPNSF